MKIAFLDHFDSFTYNLIHLLGSEPHISNLRVFDPTCSQDSIMTYRPDVVVVGPGPGRSEDYPLTKNLLNLIVGKIPVLGVCLGMQALVGRSQKCAQAFHGKTSMVFHDNSKIFEGVSNPFRCMRYHSLQISPDNDGICAWSDDQVPMAIHLPRKKALGLQFHPESFASEYGGRIISNFLEQYVL